LRRGTRWAPINTFGAGLVKCIVSLVQD
jgi:hypothetical protein